MMLSFSDLARLCRALAAPAERGVPVLSSIELLAASTGRPSLRRALDALLPDLRQGTPLDEALRRRPDHFPPNLPPLVRAGAAGGRLGTVLRRAADGYARLGRVGERFGRVVRYVASGLAVILLGMAAFFTLAHFAGGNYKRFLDDLEAGDPPWPTRILLGLIDRPGAALAALIALALWTAGGFALLWLLCRRTRLGWMLPVWGRIQRGRDLAAFSCALALRLRAGAPLPESIAGAAEAAVSPVFRRAAAQVQRRVEQGEPFSSALFYARPFPRTFAWGISLAESHGDLPGVLEALAGVHEEELHTGLDLLHAILPALGILALGNIALFFFQAFLAPLWNLLSYVNMAGPAGSGNSLSAGALIFPAILTLVIGALIIDLYILFHRRQARFHLLAAYLAALAERGLPFPEALRALAGDFRGLIGLALEDAARAVDEGRALSDAFEAHPHILPDLFRAMAAVGERSGNPAGAFRALRDTLGFFSRAHAAPILSFVYPLLLTVALTALIPRLAAGSQGVLRDLSDDLSSGGAYAAGWDGLVLANHAVFAAAVALVAVALLGGFSFPLGVTPLRAFRRAAERVLLWIPGLGRALREQSLFAFATGLGLLLRAGAAPGAAARLLAAREPNLLFRRRYEALARHVEDGGRLADFLRAEPGVPEGFVWFVESGESSGDLPGLLAEAGRHLAGRAAHAREAAARRLVPALVILNGALVLAAGWLTLAPIVATLVGMPL